MIEAALFTLLGVSQVLFVVTSAKSSRERQRIVNAVLSRTPAEFELLEAQYSNPKKRRKAEQAERAMPPIGL